MPEKIYKYESYIGFTKEQLGSYAENGDYIPYSAEEQTRIKDELEQQFNEKVSSWERNGFAKCFKNHHVNRKKIDNLMMKKFYQEVKNFSNDPTKSREERLMGLERFVTDEVFSKIESDSDLITMYRYYASLDEYKYVDNKLKNKDKDYIKRKLYDAIKSEDAIDLASLRFDSSENIHDYAASIKELQEYHNSRGSFYWLFHPINCIRENSMIKSLKSRAVERLGCSVNELNDAIEEDIKFSNLTNSDSYEIEYYANNNANGIAYSVEAMNAENNTIADRADADYNTLQNEIERIYNGEDLDNNESRQNIEVDDVRSNVSVDDSLHEENENHHNLENNAQNVENDHDSIALKEENKERKL